MTAPRLALDWTLLGASDRERDSGASPLVVAVSGGVDSMALLHALRFGARTPAAAPTRSEEPTDPSPPVPPLKLVAAHLDHAMRPDSARDAEWVAGVCRAWEVPCVVERLSPAPRSEAQAREARYAFLERVREQAGAARVVTAHHADDQAETVLFRLARGTGLRGLRGIRDARGTLVRPMLSVWREEIEAYAAAVGLGWREDPTNRDQRFARNAIRHSLLPELEAEVSPNARRSLTRLARTASAVYGRVEALESALLDALSRPTSIGGHTTDPVGGGTELDRLEIPRAGFTELPSDIQLRLIRRAVERMGGHLDRRASAAVEAALATFHPGKGLDLTGGFRLELGLDRWILLSPEGARERRAWFRAGEAPASRPPATEAGLLTPDLQPAGTRVVGLGSARWTLCWAPDSSGRTGEVPLSRSAHLPLRLRAWAPGDRIRMPYGSKTVAKLLAEAGVSAVDRPTSAVAEGAGGQVLWVPGVSNGPTLPAHTRDLTFFTCTRTSA